MGKKAGGFIGLRIKKNKEMKNRKYLFGWGHTVNVVCGEKEQVNEFRVCAQQAGCLGPGFVNIL